MRYRYKYTGNEIVNIPYLGTFEPGKEYKVEQPINHPDFEEVKEKKNKTKEI